MKHKDLTPEDFNMNDDELHQLQEGARFIYGNKFTDKELPPRQPKLQSRKVSKNAPDKPFKL